MPSYMGGLCNYIVVALPGGCATIMYLHCLGVVGLHCARNAWALQAQCIQVTFTLHPGYLDTLYTVSGYIVCFDLPDCIVE